MKRKGVIIIISVLVIGSITLIVYNAPEICDPGPPPGLTATSNFYDLIQKTGLAHRPHIDREWDYIVARSEPKESLIKMVAYLKSLPPAADVDIVHTLGGIASFSITFRNGEQVTEGMEWPYGSPDAGIIKQARNQIQDAPSQTSNGSNRN